jgi:hypothetical protein
MCGMIHNLFQNSLTNLLEISRPKPIFSTNLSKNPSIGARYQATITISKISEQSQSSRYEVLASAVTLMQKQFSTQASQSVIAMSASDLLAHITHAHVRPAQLAACVHQRCELLSSPSLLSGSFHGAPTGILGHSRGANDALLYASQHCHPADPTADEGAASALLDPKRLVVISCAPRHTMPAMLTTWLSMEQLLAIEEQGHCDWPSSQTQGLIVTKQDANVLLHELDMGAVVQAIPPTVPVLLLHGTDDEIIPVADASLFQQARPDIDVVLVDSARHAFRGKKPVKALLSAVSSFLEKHFKLFFPLDQ